MVEDVDGNLFLDCAAGIAVNSTGVSHPEVVKAIAEQAAEVHPHVGDGLLLRAAGAPRGRARRARADRRRRADLLRQLGHRGDRSRHQAVALLHEAPRAIIAFLGSFHGRSLGALSLTASKSIQRRGFGPFMPGVYHAPYPDVYRFNGSADAVRRGVARRSSRDQILVHLTSPDEVAAIVVEPIQGEGGYVVPPPAFLQGLRELTTQHGIMLVVRRSAVGHGPHGEDVRLGALRRQGRHRQHRQGHCVGAAARRHLRARRGHDVAAGRACQHVRRQPGLVRRGERDDQAAEGAARRQRRRRSGAT